ncbi:MAG: hypothetical protein ACFNZW_03360 [Coriobacteriaceae bacterium]
MRLLLTARQVDRKDYGSDYAELLQVEDELAEIAHNQRNMAKA